MNIIITGASGFIGQKLISQVVFEYPRANIVLISSKEIKPYQTLIHNNYEVRPKDFINLGIIEIDVLILLGAFTPKYNSDADNILKTKTNVDSTINILGSIPKVKKIIYISTIDVYEFKDEIITESTNTTPQTLYGFSKLFSEKIVEKFCVNNKVVFQILRLGHIYGAGEDAYKKLIPNTIRGVLNDRKVTIYNQGSAKVSFLSVTDCTKNIVESIKLDYHVGPINLVSNTSLTVREIVDLIIKLSSVEYNVEVSNLNISASLRNYVFDNVKMTKYLKGEVSILENELLDEINYMKFLRDHV